MGGFPPGRPLRGASCEAAELRDVTAPHRSAGVRDVTQGQGAP